MVQSECQVKSHTVNLRCSFPKQNKKVQVKFLVMCVGRMCQQTNFFYKGEYDVDVTLPFNETHGLGGSCNCSGFCWRHELMTCKKER